MDFFAEFIPGSYIVLGDPQFGLRSWTLCLPSIEVGLGSRDPSLLSPSPELLTVS
jgi:hypothetical protein